MDTLSLKDSLKIFSGKKVFITGHTGFKGSWLTLLLLKLGAKIKGYSLDPNTNPSHFVLLGIKNEIEHITGDIRDYNHLEKNLLDFKPDFVFHLAAQALVRKSYDETLLTMNTNIIGTANILEAVKRCESVKSFVCITSDKCYENVEWIWGYRENDTLGGHDPYSSSKACAEIIFSTYNRSFFNKNDTLGAATARAGNVIGGGDWSEDRIIPDCVRAIQAKKPIKLRSPNSTRPWQHVFEPISGYLCLAANLFENPKKFSGSWNFGPSTSEVLTVKDVAKKVVEKLGDVEIQCEDYDNKKYESNLLQLNCDKAKLKLGWKAKWLSTEALDSTSEWYNLYMKNMNIKDLSLGQLESYFGKYL